MGEDLCLLEVKQIEVLLEEHSSDAQPLEVGIGASCEDSRIAVRKDKICQDG